jgi:16S rRNA processing protein RimM
MSKQFLEAGKIVNTHGVRGEVRIQPWANSPDFLLDFGTIYIDGKSIKVLRSRIHKTMVIAALEGIETIDDAVKLKNKTVYIDRNEAKLSEGEFFIQDIIGMPVVDVNSGAEIGTLTEVLSLPASDVYVVKGETEHMIPAVPEFIDKIDSEAGVIRVRLIEGM